MLAIRLQRVGRKHEPVFRLVLTDSKNGPKSGKFIEILGSFDPRRDNDISQFNIEKIKYWMSKGAKLSLTVHNFLVGKKVIEGKKQNALPKKKAIVKAKEGEAAPASTPAPEVEKTEASTPAPAEAPKA